MKDENLTEDEAKELSQVSTVYFGLNMYHTLLYLIKIAESSRKIGDLRKKVFFDNKNTHSYERQMWSLYREVTSLKEDYYTIKL
jgi:hypothetical protein